MSGVLGPRRPAGDGQCPGSRSGGSPPGHRMARSQHHDPGRAPDEQIITGRGCDRSDRSMAGHAAHRARPGLPARHARSGTRTGHPRLRRYRPRSPVTLTAPRLTAPSASGWTAPGMRPTWMPAMPGRCATRCRAMPVPPGGPGTVPGGQLRGGRRTAGRPDTTEVRERATVHGIEVNDRGRVPAELAARFKAATEEQSPGYPGRRYYGASLTCR